MPLELSIILSWVSVTLFIDKSAFALTTAKDKNNINNKARMEDNRTLFIFHLHSNYSTLIFLGYYI